MYSHVTQGRENDIVRIKKGDALWNTFKLTSSEYAAQLLVDDSFIQSTAHVIATFLGVSRHPGRKLPQ